MLSQTKELIYLDRSVNPATLKKQENSFIGSFHPLIVLKIITLLLQSSTPQSQADNFQDDSP